MKDEEEVGDALIPLCYRGKVTDHQEVRMVSSDETG